jgi:hypothetical protein
MQENLDAEYAKLSLRRREIHMRLGQIMQELQKFEDEWEALVTEKKELLLRQFEISRVSRGSEAKEGQ